MERAAMIGDASDVDALRQLVASSRHMIVSHQHPGGAFPAAPDYPVYRYSWFRDGAFIADGASRHGEIAAADAFHRWCGTVLVTRRERIEELVGRLDRGERVGDDVLLPTRYTLEGEDAGDSWWNFQLDGYGTWLWALCAHARRHSADVSGLRPAVELAIDYLLASWRRPCYDWWEEHNEQVHVSTICSIAAGFRAVLNTELLGPARRRRVEQAFADLWALVLSEGTAHGHLVKWLGATALDGSLLACAGLFELCDAEIAQATLAAVERDLVRDEGVYRYLGDTFYGGGRWPVLAGFLGLARLRTGDRAGAFASLRWMRDTATRAGEIPEQVSTVLQAPERMAEWVDRWGSVATPLLWSHGMYLILADELGVHA